MELTSKIKKEILGAMLRDRDNYPSDKKHATALGISPSVYNNLKNGQTEKQLGEAGWIGLARRLGVTLRGEMPWKIAQTPTYIYISEQLELCQRGSVAKIICDIPNIGKTFTARAYVQSHRHAVYIDCSQVKSKVNFIKGIAKEFGVNTTGRYADIYGDLVAYLQTVDSPLVILDEAGDLQYEAFLELKALWNKTEGVCGWCMLGADGLKAKIERAIEHQKVGYTEILSRYDGGFSRVSPIDSRELEEFLRIQVAQVAKVNAPEGTNLSTIVKSSGNSLRRLKLEFTKLTAKL